MAQTQRAIKALKDAGAEISQHPNVKSWTVAQFQKARVIVSDQDGLLSSLYVITNGKEDDHMTDYFAGTWARNTKQAIWLAQH